MRYSDTNTLIVGAGFAGAVVARQLANAGRKILLVDKRTHVGGNAYDCIDANGVIIHPYGPHIFHTNSKLIFEYLSQFTEWIFYEHRVLAEVNGVKYPMPINRKTINDLYNLNLSEEDIIEFLAKVRIPIAQIKTSEDVVLNSVGKDLCDKFFRGYTKKQWGLDLSELSAGVAARIPTRSNNDDRYFTDTYQFMPAKGYSAMFSKMLSHPNIQVKTSISFEEVKDKFCWKHLVYTGPIDAFFNYKLGKLPYRSLRFEHSYLPNCNEFLPVGTVNFPNDYEYTRITEFKHITGQNCQGTSIVREYPNSDGDPYYPIPRPDNELLYKEYEKLADSLTDVTFIGRLAQYKYYNMDQVVGASLKAAEMILTL